MNEQTIQQQFEAHRHAGLQGDATAASRLTSSFGAGLVRIVRRVLRKGTGRGYLAEFILQEAGDLRGGKMPIERDDLVNEIVDRICSLVTGQAIGHRVETLALALEGTVTAPRR